MKRVLVTGGTGFVGANLVRRLLERGDEVHLLVRHGFAPWRIADIRAHCILHEQALTESAGLEALLAQIRPDWIFHLAAHGAYSWQTNLTEMVATNLQGTMNLVSAALHSGFEPFVNTGSSSEYGYQDHAPPESELPAPNSDYAFTKLSATLYCRYVAQRDHVPITTVRLYSVYGPYEDPRRFLPQLVTCALQGFLPQLADPHIARDYIFISDVLDAYLALAGVPPKESGAIYNLGTGIQTRLEDAVAIARRVFNLKPEPQWGSVPARAWDTNVWVADIRKSVNELPWQPRVRFEDGLKQLADWVASLPQLDSPYQPLAVNTLRAS